MVDQVAQHQSVQTCLPRANPISDRGLLDGAPNLLLDILCSGIHLGYRRLEKWTYGRLEKWPYGYVCRVENQGGLTLPKYRLTSGVYSVRNMHLSSVLKRILNYFQFKGGINGLVFSPLYIHAQIVFMNILTLRRPSKSNTNGLSPKFASTISPGVCRPTVG